MHYLGSGFYPDRDPWGRLFDKSYMPHRARLAGVSIADGWFGVLDGIQADQEFLKKMFSLKSPSSHH